MANVQILENSTGHHCGANCTISPGSDFNFRMVRGIRDAVSFQPVPGDLLRRVLRAVGGSCPALFRG